MAIRRAALDRVGEFDARIGRKAGTLLGQEVRDWCVRAHALGVVGYYRPDIVVHHLIPPERLTKAYFRRWVLLAWGQPRVAVPALGSGHGDSGTGCTRPCEHPAYRRSSPIYVSAARWVCSREAAIARLSRDLELSFERELWLCNFAGILHQRWRDKRLPLSGSPHRTASEAASVL